MNLKAVPKALLVTLLASSLPISSVAYAAPNANESSLVQQQWEGNWPTQNEAENSSKSCITKEPLVRTTKCSLL